MNILLTRKIMRRVYFYYFLRTLYQPRTIGFSILATGFLGLLFSVSVLAVFQNMPPLYEIRHFYQFFLSAFLATEWLVKFFVAGLLLPMIAFGVQLLRRLEPLSAIGFIRFRLPLVG